MIQLRFSRGHGPFASLIAWKSSGDWSHVDAVGKDGRLFGARFRGGVAWRAPESSGPHFLDVRLPSTREQTAAFWSFLTAQEGKPYDFRAIRAFVYGTGWQSKDRWFCSELIAAGLIECRWFGWPLVVSANKVDPNDLLLAISAKVRIGR